MTNGRDNFVDKHRVSFFPFLDIHSDILRIRMKKLWLAGVP